MKIMRAINITIFIQNCACIMHTIKHITNCFIIELIKDSCQSCVRCIKEKLVKVHMEVQLFIMYISICSIYIFFYKTYRKVKVRMRVWLPRFETSNNQQTDTNFKKMFYGKMMIYIFK